MRSLPQKRGFEKDSKIQLSSHHKHDKLDQCFNRMLWLRQNNNRGERNSLDSGIMEHGSVKFPNKGFGVGAPHGHGVRAKVHLTTGR
jgi:hypothetical protein